CKVLRGIVLRHSKWADAPAEYGPHKTLYKICHRIENLFAKLKDPRGIATRYDRCAYTFRSANFLATTIIFWV
ncbi:MAG: hypothetical protein V7701_09820, partial [Sneathiella sp.]